ncbi:MAG: phosphoribosylglycinamide formyltransferase [Bdellovibrionales bacterium]|nr:phosphoribosylglycinamide formyltransferase [Bdellovibrionales bacterium]
MNNKLKTAVLISGRGSNLKCLIKMASSYEVCAVISDRNDALGLEVASMYGIDTLVLDPKEFDSKVTFFKTLLDLIKEGEYQLICLAGFMRILPAEFTHALYGKLINIHPSLLPDFPGLDTHKRVLEARSAKHGCTVHFVDSGVDTGPIIAQLSLSVRADDTPDLLAKRVLQLEHRLYPWVANGIGSGQIELTEDKVSISDTYLKSGVKLGIKTA